VTNLLYRIVSDEEWKAFEASGSFQGAMHDLRDGFVHLSAARQVKGTLAVHYAKLPGLRLVSIRRDVLEASGRLVWEPSRGGELFPHFYGSLPIAAVVACVDLPLDEGGTHVVPTLGEG
jgi:uncharacterized protein (DUF952 family)